VTADEIILQAASSPSAATTSPSPPAPCARTKSIEHPGAAAILPILPDGRALLIAHHRPAVNQELLELPAGTLDPDETPLECARRELAEETGYRAATLEPLVSFYSTPGICNERLHVFVATNLTPGPTNLGPSEFIRPVPMTIADALDAIHTGRIADGKTIIGLLYYDRFNRPGGPRR
jgi:ADP-ribose pyrophosphatase